MQLCYYAVLLNIQVGIFILSCCGKPAFALLLVTNNSNPANKKNHPPRPAASAATTAESTATTTTTITPGALRRRRFGEPPIKLQLPLPFISAVVAALKETNARRAVSVFFETLRNEQQQSKNTALPIAYKPFSELNFPDDCVLAQRQARANTMNHPQLFLKELTPSMLNIDRNDCNAQRQWLQGNVAQVKAWKTAHGAVYFRSWKLFQDERGLHQVASLLGTPCRDPKEIRGPAPLWHGSTTIYETLNNPNDAATHLGLHYEGIPGIAPASALFACFQAATVGGGEFLLCDGRAVFRDLDATTLANLQTKKLRPTFAQLPDWLVQPSLLFTTTTTAQQQQQQQQQQRYWHEVLALFTDLTKPTDDFFLDVFPEAENNNQFSLKLTTHAAVPVILHPVTHQPVWYSGMDAGHQGNFLKNNPHLLVQNNNNGNSAYSGGGKYASEVFDVRYGNGEPISDTDLARVDEACRANTIALAMQPGDAVYLDNFSVLHGRKPFQGTRKHAVIWYLD